MGEALRFQMFHEQGELSHETDNVLHPRKIDT